MKVALVVTLLLATALAPAAQAVIIMPPVTSRCVHQVDRLFVDEGVTVCVDWGGGGCAVLVSRETKHGRDERCLVEWPPLP